jgi:hypothetical protein
MLMKKIILLALLAAGFTGHAQKLKDLLYSGKLKSDSGSVVRKTDDLRTKIDTSTKKPVTEVSRQAQAADSTGKTTMAAADTLAGADNQATTSAPGKTATPKDNNEAWKEYMDSVVATLKTELLPSKKIKKGTYYMLVEYAIEPDGEVTINNVYPAPENSYLQQQVKERLTLTAPRLSPVLASNGKPRKVIRKYSFTLVKE